MIFDALVGCLDGPFGYSRALEPGLRRRLRSLPGSQELPFVRGRTVVPEGFGHTVVVGFPNYLGVFEDLRTVDAVYLTSRWSRLRSLPDRARTVVVEPGVEPHVAVAVLEGGRLLAKRLRQLPGVQIAIPPQSPILAVLVHRASEIKIEQPGMVLLSGFYPELPGGIRIELPQDARSAELNRYAATVEEIISQEA